MGGRPGSRGEALRCRGRRKGWLALCNGDEGAASGSAVMTAQARIGKLVRVGNLASELEQSGIS